MLYNLATSPSPFCAHWKGKKKSEKEVLSWHAQVLAYFKIFGGTKNILTKNNVTHRDEYK